jgi:2-(3-amino-3-carboxypropyl)histidine synthase
MIDATFFLMRVLFVPVKYRKSLENTFLEDILSNIKEKKKIGIFTTIQFLNQIEQLDKFLKKNGKTVIIGKSNYRASEKGQVLGCDPMAGTSIEAKVDCFVYLGSGFFHPLSVALKTNKEIIIANPLTNEVSMLDKSKVEQLRNAKKRMLNEFSKAKKVGILVCTKFGQYDLKAAEETEKKLNAKGKKAYIFLFDTLNPEELINFNNIEAWVNTACPRISIDDAERIGKPIIDIEDLGIERSH